MKKQFGIISLILAFTLAVASGCGGGGNGGTGNETQGPQGSGDKPKTVDEIIKDAEDTSYLSGRADEDALYDGGEADLQSVVPVIIQKYSPESFPSFEADGAFFTPVSDDYLIASFEAGRTAIYEFYHDGSLLAVRGRIEYGSEEELLNANADKDLKEDRMNEKGYAYHDNVLYYLMSQDAVFAASLQMDKYSLLAAAEKGNWEEYVFWFSKPYEDKVTEYDTEKWERILDLIDAELPKGAAEE